MERYRIGEAIVTLGATERRDWRGVPEHRGAVEVTDHNGTVHRWTFGDLHNGAGGSSYYGDDPDAEAAANAIAFASYYTSGERGEDTPEWAPPAEVADAIDAATGYARDGSGEFYSVERWDPEAEAWVAVVDWACPDCGEPTNGESCEPGCWHPGAVFRFENHGDGDTQPSGHYYVPEGYPEAGDPLGPFDSWGDAYDAGQRFERTGDREGK